MKTPKLIQRLQFLIIRLITRTLKLLGLRDPLFAARQRQRRARRTREEARGSDLLPRPAAFEMDVATD